MEDTDNAVVDRLAAVLRVAVSVSARNKYLYDRPTAFVPGRAVCVREFECL